MLCQLAYDSPQRIRNICIGQVPRAPEQSVQENNMQAGCSRPDERLHTLPAGDDKVKLRLAYSKTQLESAAPSTARRDHTRCTGADISYAHGLHSLCGGPSPVLQLHNRCQKDQKLRP